MIIGCFLKGPFSASFSLFRLFNTVDRKQMFNINIANDWIQTADLWYQKELLYELSHNHCPFIGYFTHKSPNE